MAGARPRTEVLPPLLREPLPPVAAPILVDNDGVAWVPHAFTPNMMSFRWVCHGIGLAWAPAPEIGGVLLIIAGGNPAAPTNEGLCSVISRQGLREIVADLQSIDAQLGDMP